MRYKMKMTGLLAAMLGASAAMAATPLQTTAATTTGASDFFNLLSANATGPNETATQQGGGSVNGTAPSVGVAQFDPNTGILVGAQVQARTAVTSRAGVAGTFNSANPTGTIKATSVNFGIVYAAGQLLGTIGNVVAQTQCDGAGCGTDPAGQTNTATDSINDSKSVSLGKLADLVGLGTVEFRRSTNAIVQVKTGTSSDILTGTAVSEARFEDGTYSIIYDYINFSRPSLNNVDLYDLGLDFGTLVQNSGTVTLNFNVYNFGDDSSADLMANGFYRTVNNLDFSTDFAAFDALAGGGVRNFTVTFNPQTLGANTETFAFDFSDKAPLGAVGARDYTLYLTATANVVASAVPEASTWLMMIAGFGLIGGVARRHRLAVA